jgi:hypothetical protein
LCPRKSTPLFNTIANDLIRSIEEAINAERETRVYVGNHEIELINATPLNFVYDPPIGLGRSNMVRRSSSSTIRIYCGSKQLI